MHVVDFGGIIHFFILSKAQAISPQISNADFSVTKTTSGRVLGVLATKELFLVLKFSGPFQQYLSAVK
jgi:hypothetical protein